ncbi:sialidase family protein [Nonomuraea glycinis]|uniref:sialidase family protein n=1 Tax=Nonomuraea glycinis TaxID=2047744 RepID=UPI0033A56FBD
MAERHPTSVPYRAGTDGYHTFRIPAVVVTRAGTVLAFAEGRHGSAGDSGHIDLVLKSSTDGGGTWGELRVVAAEPRQGTVGNPAPVVTADGRIILVSVRQGPAATEKKIRRGEVAAADGRRVYVQHSDDDGLTWRPVHTVSGLPAAYSDLTAVDAGTIGLLYETGDFGPYASIAFRRIAAAELA